MDMQREPEVFTCEVREVYSGDDLIVLVDLRVENLFKRQRVRLYGVDTPNGANQADDSEAGRIRRQIKALARYRSAQLRVISKTNNSWVCIVEVESSDGKINLNELLQSQGYEYKRVPK